MWINRSRLDELAERELLFEARIKELENIICPAEQHDYAIVSEKASVIGGYGTTIYDRRYVCKKCLKAFESSDFV